MEKNQREFIELSVKHEFDIKDPNEDIIVIEDKKIVTMFNPLTTKIILWGFSKSKNPFIKPSPSFMLKKDGINADNITLHDNILMSSNERFLIVDDKIYCTSEEDKQWLIDNIRWEYDMYDVTGTSKVSGLKKNFKEKINIEL